MPRHEPAEGVTRPAGTFLGGAGGGPATMCSAGWGPGPAWGSLPAGPKVLTQAQEPGPDSSRCLVTLAGVACQASDTGLRQGRGAHRAGTVARIGALVNVRLMTSMKLLPTKGGWPVNK